MKIYLSETVFRVEHFDFFKEIYERFGVKMEILTSFWYYHNNAKGILSPQDKEGSNIKKFLDNYKRIGYKSQMLLDSGVYSARKKGVKIDNKLLAKFYHKYSEIFEAVFNNDDGTVDEQIDNLKELIDMGVPTIGIYHPGSINDRLMTDDDLRRLTDLTDFISLSFYTIPLKERELMTTKMYDWLYENGRSHVKVHTLGTEKISLLSKFPFYSTDATTFLREYTMGMVGDFNHNKLKIIGTSLIKETEQLVRQDILRIKCIGSPYEPRYERMYQSILARAEYQKFLTDIWEARGVIWN